MYPQIPIAISILRRGMRVLFIYCFRNKLFILKRIRDSHMIESMFVQILRDNAFIIVKLLFAFKRN